MRALNPTRCVSTRAMLMRVAAGLLLCLSLVAVTAGGAQAATACPAGANTWTGGANNGLWGSAGNWSTGVAPGGGDNNMVDVCIPDGSGTVTLAPFTYLSAGNPAITTIPTINSLTIGSGATLVILGETTTQTSGSPVNREQLTATNGGSIAAGGALQLHSTNLGGPGTPGGVAALNAGRPITNAGAFSAVVDPGSQFYDQLGASIVDAPGSSATVASGVLNIENGASFTNQSTFTVDPGADTEIVYGNPFTDPPAAFINDGAYVNDGTTTVQPGGRGAPITWTQQGGSVSGNPILLQNNAQLADAAGTGAFLFNNKAGELSGTIPAGQTVTVEADAYGNDTYLNTLTLNGSQVINQGVLSLHTPNVSTDTSTSIRVTGSELINQGTITSTSDAPNLANELDVSLVNQHGAGINVSSGVLAATNGQSVTNDGTIAIAPGAQLQEFANQFLTGPETFTNAADGTIAPQIASATSFGTVQFGGNSTVNLGGAVTPSPVGGYVPAVGTALAAFPITTAPTGGTPKITGTFGAVSAGFTADYSHETSSPPYIGLIYSPAATVSPPPNPTTPTTPTKPSVPGSHKPSVKGSKILVRLSCPKGSGCKKATVTVTVTEKVRTKKGKSRTEKVVVATGSATPKAGKSKTVTLKLNRRGVKLLAKAHHLKVRVAVSVAGKTRKTYTVSLSRRSKSRKRHHGGA